MAKDKILYTTKGRYDTPMNKAMASIFIPFFLLEGAIWYFFHDGFALILDILLAVFVIREIMDVKSMKKSYVELYEGHIQGVSMRGLLKKSEAFRAAYSDITVIYTVDDILTVRTAQGKYRVQVYKCGPRVKDLIGRRMAQQKEQR